jgi:hypothetical protein
MRMVTMVGVLATVGVLALVVLHFVRDPIAVRREQLRQELAMVQPHPVDVGPLNTQVDIDSIQQAITGKEALWKELIPPPPPPPPPPKKAPNLAELLEGVQPTRQRVGEYIRIIVKGNPRGARFTVGDKINGVTIKEITATEVIFEYPWEGQVLTHTLPRS